MGGILAFFLSNPWRTGAMALIALVAFYHFWTVPHLEAKVTSLTEQIGVDKATIELQNSAVNDWKKQADVAKKAQKDAMDLADKIAQSKQGVATKIMQVPVPTPDKECDSTLGLLKVFQ